MPLDVILVMGMGAAFVVFAAMLYWADTWTRRPSI
jgi:hypothetical protein